MQKILIYLILLLCSNSYSQNGWFIQNSGTNASLRSIKFLNGNTGWCAGSNGNILKTTNGGNNWITIENDFSFDLTSIFFISDSDLFIAGDSGKIIKSSDSGNNWYLLNTGTSEDLNSLFFINSLTGFAAGFNGTILKTINAGANWQAQLTGTNIQLNSIYFANERKGWVSGLGGIFYSSTGGSNWIPQFIDGFLNLNSIFFADSLYGWSAYYDNNTFGPENVKTSDGGLSWINYSMDNSYSISIFFVNRYKGWSSGFFGKLMYSGTGGTQWTQQLSNTGENLNSIYFIDSLTGWCAGNNGVILRTNSGGIITSISSNSYYLPLNFSLEQNFPNPFNSQTIIKFNLLNAEFVTVSIYDLLGNEIAKLIDGQQEPGNYSFTFDGKNIPGGIYYCRLKTNSFSQTRKMILLK